MAYRKGLVSPLRKNAEIHSEFPYLIRIDLKDFFPSISPELLKAVLPFSLIDRNFALLVLCCFYHFGEGKYGLPIGAPTSPFISNMVMEPIDQMLEAKAKELGGRYTRYADDIVFSSSNPDLRDIFLKFVSDALIRKTKGLLAINEGKTRKASRASRRSVTGVILTQNGSLSIGRKRKRDIRSLIHKASHNELSEEEVKRLRGLLAYCADIEPSFIERMVTRYGDIVLRIRRGNT